MPRSQASSSLPLRVHLLHHLQHRPWLPLKASPHRRRVVVAALLRNGPVWPAEVVDHRAQAERVGMVLCLLAGPVGRAFEPPQPRPDIRVQPPARTQGSPPSPAPSARTLSSPDPSQPPSRRTPPSAAQPRQPSDPWRRMFPRSPCTRSARLPPSDSAAIPDQTLGHPTAPHNAQNDNPRLTILI